MSHRDPMVCIYHMHDHTQEVLEMVKNRSRTDLDTDRMLNLALVWLMEIIGEAAARVPNEFRCRHPQIPWREVTDLRNQLIHGYDTINFDILWTIIQDDLPPLIGQLEAIIGEKT